MVIVWKVKKKYQNSSVLDCVTQCSQSAAHLCEQFLQVQQIGLIIWSVKIISEMTCNVLSGMLNPTHSLTQETGGELCEIMILSAVKICK